MQSVNKFSAPEDAPDTSQLLLEVQEKIYVRAVTGVFARWRWGMVAVTQLLFYGLPWLNWNSRQAVLFDLAERKFYLFGLILHPQDFIYLTTLLVISAMSLFLFTTVAGRLWCGYTCPQTVYTEIFMWIEHKVEGNRNQRIKLDKSPWSYNKLRIKATKHGLWVVVALWTGITFVGYFSPIRQLVPQVFTLSANFWQGFWIVFYAVATWGNAGFLREQVCKYMCPYARFQGVMFDRDTLVITYDQKRGDPRGSRRRDADTTALGLGDCVDCGLCVQVCPTGIDIRDGQQYECIGCAACIDACDSVMEKVGYEKGLVRYDTLSGLEQNLNRSQLWRRVLRPRVMVYTTVVVAAFLFLAFSLGTRVPLKVDVIRDRGALSRQVGDGVVENVYRLMIINSAEQVRSYQLSVDGLDSLAIESDKVVTLESASSRLVPVRLRAHAQSGLPGSNKIYFGVTAIDNNAVTRREETSFYLPSNR